MVEGGPHPLAVSVREQVERKFQEAAARERRQRETQRLFGLDVRRRSLVLANTRLDSIISTRNLKSIIYDLYDLPSDGQVELEHRVEANVALGTNKHIKLCPKPDDISTLPIAIHVKVH